MTNLNLKPLRVSLSVLTNGGDAKFFGTSIFTTPKTIGGDILNEITNEFNDCSLEAIDFLKTIVTEENIGFDKLTLQHVDSEYIIDVTVFNLVTAENLHMFLPNIELSNDSFKFKIHEKECVQELAELRNFGHMDEALRCSMMILANAASNLAAKSDEMLEKGESPLAIFSLLNQFSVNDGEPSAVLEVLKKNALMSNVTIPASICNQMKSL